MGLNLRRRRGWRKDIAAWDGTLPPPHAVKAQAVSRYGRALDVLVETGTYRGTMIEAVRREFDRVISIELDPGLYAAAKSSFAHDQSVTILEGDSAAVLPGVVSELDVPAVFWLDGHYSGDGTAGSQPPIIAELDAVLADSAEHVVLVDDAAVFGSGGYPELSEVERLAAGRRFEVRDNIIRITPC